MIIFWGNQQKEASDPVAPDVYMSSLRFQGIQRIYPIGAYPASPPYGSFIYRQDFKKFFGFLEDSGWLGIPATPTNPMIVLSKSSSVNQDVGGANGTEVFWTWDGEVKKDSGFTHSTITNSERVQVSAAGWYHIRFCGNAQQTGAARTTLQGIIRVNGGSTLRDGTIRDYTRGSVYGNLSPGLETIMYLEADDYIEIGTKVEDTDAVYVLDSNGAEIADEENKLIVIKVA